MTSRHCEMYVHGEICGQAARMRYMTRWYCAPHYDKLAKFVLKLKREKQLRLLDEQLALQNSDFRVS